MARPVNLNRYRKQKARREDKAHADENAVRFGRSAAHKDRHRAQIDKSDRALDGHELEK